MQLITIKKSKSILNITLYTTMISLLVIPIFLYLYINYTSLNYTNLNNYFKITTSAGQEDFERTSPSDRPITNLETTKDWLKLSIINLMTYDANTYNKEPRYRTLENILDENVLKSFWQNDNERIRQDIINGYLRNSAIISFKPILIGEMKNSAGENLWKFYLEVQIKQESKFESYPRYYKKRIQTIVKEIDVNENFKGIGIIEIDIK